MNGFLTIGVLLMIFLFQEAISLGKQYSYLAASFAFGCVILLGFAYKKRVSQPLRDSAVDAMIGFGVTFGFTPFLLKVVSQKLSMELSIELIIFVGSLSTVFGVHLRQIVNHFSKKKLGLSLDPEQQQKETTIKGED